MNKILYAVLVFLATMPLVTYADTFEHDLFFGLTHDKDVIRLQEFLTEQNVYSGSATGNFFMVTREAVKRFQEREKISPQEGYFGAKTRARANMLLIRTSKRAIPSSQQSQADTLRAMIEKLQIQLKSLQEKSVQYAPVITVPVSSPFTFIKRPMLSQAGFLNTIPSDGARHPYRIVFDWSVDGGVYSESLICTPPFPMPESLQKGHEYFPEAHTNYACTVTTRNQSGSEAKDSLSFETPSWFGVSGGVVTTTFPQIATNPFKIGNVTLFNGTKENVLISQLVVDVADAMNSNLNRGREVIFILRNGATGDSDMISKSPFRFNSLVPSVDSPHKYQLMLPFNILLAPGEEKTISLWVENFEYVVSGFLTLQLNSLLTTAPLIRGGGFSFRFER